MLVLAGCAALGAEPVLTLVASVGGPASSPSAGSRASSVPRTAASVVAGPAVDPSFDPGASASASTSGEPSATPRTPRKPKPTPTPRLRPPPRRGPFAIDLYRRGDFVTEYESIYCAPAAAMTMMNIIDRGRPDRSRATQDHIYRLGRRLSSRFLDGPGVEPEGWAGALNREGYGPYLVRIYRTRKAAIRAAAVALRFTGKPVGLVTWRGVHSWVMSGFRSTSDPAFRDDFEVTDLSIEDVWYPRSSSIWGASRPPDALVPVERLPEDFLAFSARYVHGKSPKIGNFVVILPTRR
jgi:hypothetical protein